MDAAIEVCGDLAGRAGGQLAFCDAVANKRRNRLEAASLRFMLTLLVAFSEPFPP